MPVEGTGVSQLSSVIKSLGYNEFDSFDLATMTSISPTRIKVDGMALELDANDIVMAEHLTDHERSISISGGTVSGTVSGGATLNSLTVTDATMTVKSPLVVGDRVIVASTKSGQVYVVLDKAVMI